MTNLVLLHNPRCSKSRQAAALLDERGAKYSKIEYLDQPLDEAALRDLVAKLGVEPRAIVRTKEARFGELGLDGADDATTLRAVAQHPELMERPIAILGDRAVIARPPERVLELLD